MATPAFNLPEADVEAANEKMVAFIEAQLPEGDWSAPVEAERLLASLPDDLLTDWLKANTRQFLSRLLVDIRHHERAQAFRLNTVAKRASTFAKYKTGERSLFDMRFVVSDDNMSRRLGDMTREDLVYVRDRYLTTASDATTKAAFLDDLASQTPVGKTVGEALQESTVASVLDKYFNTAESAA